MRDTSGRFVYRSYMGKTITIDDDAYKLLLSLKQGAHDSFTKVIRRHVHKPAETAGELLDAMDTFPPPPVDLDLLKRVEKARGRRSVRRN
jgi:predicted CopG family antitoxin